MKVIIIIVIFITILLLNDIIAGESVRAESEIKEIIEEMSLEEKVGQLFMVGFSGTEAGENIKNLIENYHVGGIIYFRRNIESPEQTAELSRKLQKLAFRTTPGLPLFISTDQEGGVVTRLQGGTHFPGNMTLGAGRSQGLAFKAGKATARELKYSGINMNLAPVLDVNNNPDNPVIGVRSFGGDPELVAEMGTAYIKGLQGEGVIAVGKHFPGHGDTDTDSHLSLPIINHDRERLEKVELYPFRKAVQEDIDSIMTAHVHFPAVEDKTGTPATLSKKVINGLLRKDLEFQGVILTDCMEMKAISESPGTVEGAVKTLQAGSDQVLISHTYEKQIKAIEEVVKAVKEGKISEKSVDTSLIRILKLKKKRMGLETDNQLEQDVPDREFSQNVAKQIAEKGVTVARGRELFPVDNIEDKDIGVITFESSSSSLVEDENNYQQPLLNRLSERSNSVISISVDEDEKISDVKEKLSSCDIIIVCTFDAVTNIKQVKIADKLVEDFPVIILAVRNPYDLKLLEKVPIFLTTYDYSPASLRAAADIITGKLEPSGKLPVEILN